MAQVKSLQTGIKFKDTPIGKIPVDWEAQPLINAVGGKDDLIVAGPFGSNLKVEDYKDEGVPIIRLQNVEFCKFVNKATKYISSEKARELSYHSFKKGDIVLAKLGLPIGKTCIVPDSMEEGIVVADVVRISVDERSSDKKYIMYALNSDCAFNQLNRGIVGTTRPRVNLGQIRSLLIPLPPFPEQKKIAEILTTVDDDIEETDRIIEKLKELKKGLMQELLTRGIGHKKFKKTEIGEIPDEWEVCNIENVASKEKNAIKAGPFGSALKKSVFVGKGYKVYGQEPVIPDDFSVGNYYINEETFTKLRDFEIKPGDILISLVGTFGKVSVVPKDVELGIINPRLIKITLNTNNVLPSFFKYLMTSDLMQNQMANYTHGLTMGILNTTTIKMLVLPLPSLKEQNQIVAILSAIDSEISYERSHKEQLESLKKSLMQVLLTGKVRVELD